MAPLDASPSDLHVSTVTVALNVNRTPGSLLCRHPVVAQRSADLRS